MRIAKNVYTESTARRSASAANHKPKLETGCAAETSVLFECPRWEIVPGLLIKESVLHIVNPLP